MGWRLGFPKRVATSKRACTETRLALGRHSFHRLPLFERLEERRLLSYTLGADFNADTGLAAWSQEASNRSFLLVKASQGNDPASFLPKNMSSVPPIMGSFTFGVFDFADPDEYENPTTRVANPSNLSQVSNDARFQDRGRSYGCRDDRVCRPSVLHGFVASF